MTRIRPATLDEQLSNGDAPFVLDIREHEDYERGHIDGSYNAPAYDALRSGDTAALDSHLDAVPSDSAVVTVCKRGVVARRATAHLREQGYDATTLAGGMWAWRHYENETLLYRVRSFVRRLFS